MGRRRGASALVSALALRHLSPAAATATCSMSGSASDGGSGRKEYVRPDGVRMGYDPYHPEMIAKYGPPGETDDEGFNPYADTVGPGIYGWV